MRKCWTLREGLTAVLAVAAAALLTRLAIQFIAALTPNILPPLLVLLLLPALCGGAMAFSLRRQSRSLLPAALGLAIVTAGLVLLGQFPSAGAQLRRGLLGTYNPEAAVFDLLFAAPFCTGLSAGVGIGVLLWRCRSQTR